MKDLMWICGLIQADVTEKINQISLINNADISLSRRFLDFPLHVSFKRSFYTGRFEEVKNDAKQILLKQGKICCGRIELQRMNNMIWLCFEKDEELKKIHEKIDSKLKKQLTLLLTHKHL